ncbi:PhzF family isomerase [Leuconostoc mesenteroides]|uniref:PhzF family isomerase n=1 Tax=Leuconostoc mesenteroides TaxID=1245 RepID=UPI002954C622|nr:PhzF family isomerase [Leuconostoc mesenteroides]MDV7738592.1 PhzF family isomerase [Leuconostoc mesenteroides]
MKKYNLYQVDAFTKKELEGNPAGVVTNADGLSEYQMQQLARELNNSETAFICKSEHNNADFRVRFFTPTTEVPICGHATIGAQYAYAVEQNLDSQIIQQETQIGILPVEIVKNEDDYKIIMTQGKVSVEKPLKEQYAISILKALKLNKNDLNPKAPIAISSTGHSKVMICISSDDILNHLQPNFELLKEISKKINCNGFHVFTMNPGNNPLIHGRVFAPISGITEDPVTGNANGPLGAYLVKYNLIKTNASFLEFNAVQGEAINRPGQMGVHVDIENGEPVKVQITGTATIAFSTKIDL